MPGANFPFYRTCIEDLCPEKRDREVLDKDRVLLGSTDFCPYGVVGTKPMLLLLLPKFTKYNFKIPQSACQ